MAHCVFCSIVAGDSPAEVVHEDEHTLAFMDVMPQGEGHTLVIPKAPSRNLLDAGAANLLNVTLNGVKLQLGAGSTLGVAGALTLTSGAFDVTTTAPNTRQPTPDIEMTEPSCPASPFDGLPT